MNASFQYEPENSDFIPGVRDLEMCNFGNAGMVRLMIDKQNRNHFHNCTFFWRPIWTAYVYANIHKRYQNFSKNVHI